jgi:subtilisin-like proprotein convertase family protein
MPAELRATFGGEDFNVAIPDGGEVEVPLDTFGLASVHTDVVLNLWVSHRRAEDLQIVLTNPSGTEVVVSDKVAGSGVYLRDVGLLGFPGDEDANGRWTLTLRDTEAGESGTLRGFSLQVTSRWD